MNMNQTLIMIGDWPVRVLDALLGFGGVVLVADQIHHAVGISGPNGRRQIAAGAVG